MPDRTIPWDSYNQAQLSRDPRAMCRRVLALAGPGRHRLAVDLGCGAGVETKALRDAGWQVLAVDSDPTMPGNIDHLVGGDPAVSTCVTSLEDFELPPADLVHASYALPFVAPATFSAAWPRLLAALNPGGWLAVTLFGERDAWAGQAGMTFHSREAVEELVAGLDLVAIDEGDEDGPAFSGPKHWHVFHVIARRP